MENLEIIISLAGACIGLIGGIAALIAKYAKSAKAKKIAEGIAEICNALPGYIRSAETLPGADGDAKKNYVMTEAEKFAAERGIPFDGQAVGSRIDEYVALTKCVNASPACGIGEKTPADFAEEAPSVPAAADAQEAEE